MKPNPRVDEIKIQKPEKTSNDWHSVVVSFRRAAWTNFKRRKFYAMTESGVIAKAQAFAALLPSLENWAPAELAEREPREPVTKRRLAGGSVYYDGRKSKWGGSVYFGVDSVTGKKIIRQVYADTREAARLKLDALISEHNESMI